MIGGGRLWAGLLALATGGLIVAFSATTPLFEAPDEPGHYGYVQRLASGGGLPVQGQDGAFDPEWGQPPLYYAVESLLARILPSGEPGVPPFERLNVFQNRTLEGNANLFGHVPAEGWPWSGEVLRLHALRLLNLAFAAVTLLATYGIAREAGLAPWLAVAAAASLGLLPQFGFITGALNADNAVTAFSSLALWLLLRWLNCPISVAKILPHHEAATSAAAGSLAMGRAERLAGTETVALGGSLTDSEAAASAGSLADSGAGGRTGSRADREAVAPSGSLAHTGPAARRTVGAAVPSGGQPKPGLAPVAWLGLAVGAAMLSKLSGLAVLALVVGWMVWRAWQARSRPALGQAVLAGAIGLAIGGWWYVRNLLLYRDVLGWRPMLTAIGAMRRPQALGPIDAARALWHARDTAVGMFGWNNLGLPEPIYRAADALALLAIVGLVLLVARSLAERAWKVARPVHLAVLASWALAFGLSLVRWVEVNTDAAQWRLLLPAFPALAVLFVLGLSRLSKALVALVPAGLGALSVASLALVIRPAYTPDVAYNGPVPHPAGFTFGDQLQLAGYGDPQVTDGQVTLDLYWRATRPIPDNDVVDVTALDVGGQTGLKEETWPQEGRAITSTWPPGALVRDRHVLRAPSQPGVWNLYVDVYRPLPGAPRLSLPDGGTTASIGRFLVPPPRTPAASQPVAEFDNGLALVSQRETLSGGRLTLDLQWLASKPPDRDYTVFVHVLDGDGKLLAQDDSQPAGGRFPTGLLPNGALIDDQHVVEGVTPRAAQLEIGLYDAANGQRVRLAGSSEDAIRLPLETG